MADFRWCVTYENTETLNSWSVPQAYRSIKRSQEYIFELIGPNGIAIYEWDVKPGTRLLFAKRNTLAVISGEATTCAIIGLEERDGSDIHVWRFIPRHNGIEIETRDSWPEPGESGYSEWKRPIPIDGDE